MSLIKYPDLTIPSQNGKKGFYLTTDGINTSWIALPTFYSNFTNRTLLVGNSMSNQASQNSFNTALGHEAFAAYTGDNSVAVGTGAMFWGSGQYNTSVGAQSSQNIGGNLNTSLGAYAYGGPITGYYPNNNTAIGARAMTSGSNLGYNTAVGTQSMYSSRSASYNTAVGNYSMQLADNAYMNVAVGHNALGQTLSGSYNVALGPAALLGLYGTYSNNIGIGLQSGAYLVTGNNNIFIGGLAGYVSPYLMNGSNNIIIGYQTTGTASYENDAITIGNSSNNRFRIPGLGIDWNSSTVPTSLPSQSGNSGKYLTTNGTSASWATVSGYSAPTLGSTSIASGSTVSTISALTLSGTTLTGSLTAGGSTGTSGYFLQSTGSGVQWAVSPAAVTSSSLSTNSLTTIETIALSSFTAIKYTITIKQGTKIRTSEVLTHTDGTSVDYAEYSIMSMNGGMNGVTISVSTSGSNAILQVQIMDAATTNATVKFTKVTI